jgi:hypothetical protein
MSTDQKELLNKLDILAKKIDVLTMVTAANVFQGKPLSDSIAFLLKLGLETKEIALILGTKPNSVRALKSQLTKKRKKKEKPKEEKAVQKNG